MNYLIYQVICCIFTLLLCKMSLVLLCRLLQRWYNKHLVILRRSVI